MRAIKHRAISSIHLCILALTSESDLVLLLPSVRTELGDPLTPELAAYAALDIRPSVQLFVSMPLAFFLVLLFHLLRC